MPLVVRDPKVSACHFILSFLDGRWRVEDGNGSKPSTKSKTADSCPKNPTIYGNKIIGRVPGVGRQTLTHPCGRKLACKGSKASWILSCNWI